MFLMICLLVCQEAVDVLEFTMMTYLTYSHASNPNIVDLADI